MTNDLWTIWKWFRFSLNCLKLTSGFFWMFYLSHMWTLKKNLNKNYREINPIRIDSSDEDIRSRHSSIRTQPKADPTGGVHRHLERDGVPHHVKTPSEQDVSVWVQILRERQRWINLSSWGLRSQEQDQRHEERWKNHHGSLESGTISSPPTQVKSSERCVMSFCNESRYTQASVSIPSSPPSRSSLHLSLNFHCDLVHQVSTSLGLRITTIMGEMWEEGFVDET